MHSVAPVAPLPHKSEPFSISINAFPESLHDILKEIDDEGNGILELDEITEVFQNFAEQKKAAKDGNIALSQLPKELRPTLKVFDVDNDGTVGAVELANAAQMYKDSKNMTKRLTKAVAVLLFIMIALVGTIVGLTAHVIETSKETKMDGGQMVTPSGQSVSTGTNELDLPLATLLFLPDDVVSKVQRLQFASVDNVNQYYRAVRSINKVTDKSLEIVSSEGDTMTWTAGSDDLVIKLAGGQTWKKSAACTKCSSVNVVQSPEVDAAVDKTLKALPSQTKFTRHLSGFSCW
jgi:hypothetical protein